MNESWTEHKCAEIKAHYTFYPVPVAAALWCGIPEDQVHEVLKRCVVVKDAVLRHPTIECIEFRCRAIHDAIQNGQLDVARENGVRATDHVRADRRHVYLLDLKAWMAEKFPTDKPPLLFDEIERSAHPHITADTYRAVKADRDALKSKNDLLTEELESLIKENELLRVEKSAFESQRRKERNVGERSEATYIVIIAGLLSLLTGKTSLGKPNSIFRNQTAIVNAFLKDPALASKVSQRTLDAKFAEANRCMGSLS
jgi:hypothetical protein